MLQTSNNNNTLLNPIINETIESSIFSKESGIIGIKNLGNTCYLNSALQTLTHLQPLLEYFIKGKYSTDIQLNKHLNLSLSDDSPLNQSYHSFTDHFCNFIKQMWSGHSKKYLIPSDLRNSLIQLYPEFNNSNQQDAHEILTLILDTLSTALNRVINDGQTITQAIEIGAMLTNTQSSIWNNSHKAVNDSYIIDLFFGQMQSTLQCCYCESIVNSNYDPFSCLELPIPNEYKIFLYFIPLKKTIRPMKMFIKINDNLQFKHIIPKVKHFTDYNILDGTFYWVFDNKLEKLVDNEERCGDLMMRMSFLFLIETNNGQQRKEMEKRQFYSALNFSVSNNESVHNNITFPRIFSYGIVPDDAVIYTSIWNDINDYVKNYLHSSDSIEALIKSKVIKYTIKSTYNATEVNDSNCTEEDNSQMDVDVDDINNIPSNTNNTNNGKYTCLLCHMHSSSEFTCECINTLLSNDIIDLKVNSSLRSFIENLRETFILQITIQVSHEMLKIKELNRCRDYTSKIISEKELDIYDLCDYFFAEEKICGNYTCINCGPITNSFKKQELHRFPEVLILHLKRFKYEQMRQKGREDKSLLNIGEKNDTPIEFRNEIDLTRYNMKKTIAKYQLNSVIYHKGKISSGHYTAICKHPYTDVWMEFDDKNVVMLNEYSLPKEDAYILFYKKMSLV